MGCVEKPVAQSRHKARFPSFIEPTTRPQHYPVWRLLNATLSSVDCRTELAEAFTPAQERKQAFYPLTFPISCGPGSIAAILYLVFRYAQRLLRPLGEACTVILLRLSAFILLCLGVQIVWDGACELLRGLLLSVALH